MQTTMRRGACQRHPTAAGVIRQKELAFMHILNSCYHRSTSTKPGPVPDPKGNVRPRQPRASDTSLTIRTHGDDELSSSGRSSRYVPIGTWLSTSTTRTYVVRTCTGCGGGACAVPWYCQYSGELAPHALLRGACAPHPAAGVVAATAPYVGRARRGDSRTTAGEGHDAAAEVAGRSLVRSRRSSSRRRRSRASAAMRASSRSRQLSHARFVSSMRRRCASSSASRWALRARSCSMRSAAYSSSALRPCIHCSWPASARQA